MIPFLIVPSLAKWAATQQSPIWDRDWKHVFSFSCSMTLRVTLEQDFEGQRSGWGQQFHIYGEHYHAKVNQWFAREPFVTTSFLPLRGAQVLPLAEEQEVIRAVQPISSQPITTGSTTFPRATFALVGSLWRRRSRNEAKYLWNGKRTKCFAMGGCDVEVNPRLWLNSMEAAVLQSQTEPKLITVSTVISPSEQVTASQQANKLQ